MARQHLKTTLEPPRPVVHTTGPAQRSKLSRAHFAFLRGWFQGLDEKTLWNLYLTQAGSFDVRRCRALLKDLQAELGAVARRAGRPALAGLLRRKGDLLAAGKASGVAGSAPAGKVPDLEEFSQQFSEDMYSQAELIELWREAYASRQTGRPNRRDAVRRRGQLIERQMTALEWLEKLASELPQPLDLTSLWLDPVVAARLTVVGIRTLRELTFFVAHRGYRWYTKVPRMGVRGASVIVRWLEKQAETLGPLPATALFPKSQVTAPMRHALASRAVPGIAPLERVQIPQSLATSDPATPGSNRAPAHQCKLDAVNDFQAVHEWLSLRPEGSHTRRAYRREAERFLLWSVFERQRALSALTAKDCVAYREFLAAPGPLWVGPRNVQRWSPDWRPFEGPLSASSAKTATTILGAMCGWLMDRRYLDSNPWKGVPASVRPPAMPSLRSLSRHQWGFVEEWLGQLPDNPASHRTRMLFEFAYRSGLREAELAAAKVAWLRHEQLDDGTWAWSIMVLGKRAKWREVALPSSAVSTISMSFRLRGLSEHPLENPPETPLIAALPSAGGTRVPCPALTPGRIYEIVKSAFKRCASWVSERDPKSADRIRIASTHWLRHTHGSHAVETMPIEILQAQMGHESPTTTALYARAEKSRRQREVEKAFG